MIATAWCQAQLKQRLCSQFYNNNFSKGFSVFKHVHFFMTNVQFLRKMGFCIGKAQPLHNENISAEELFILTGIFLREWHSGYCMSLFSCKACISWSNSPCNYGITTDFRDALLLTSFGRGHTCVSQVRSSNFWEQALKQLFKSPLYIYGLKPCFGIDVFVEKFQNPDRSILF